MKYTIELTNKQKKQMDCIIDIVHRYVGFNPKLEPIKATNVEDTKEYQIGYKVGFEDGKKQAIEEIPELANKENEIYNDGYNKGLEDGKADAIYNTDMIGELKQVEYIRGLEDARQTLLNLLEIPSGEWGSIFDQDSYYVEAIFKHYSISEIAERIEAYEEKKKVEEVENYHILVDTLRTVTEEYPKETIVSALSEFGFEVDKLRGEEDEKN